MKNSQTDRYYNRLQKCLKEIDKATPMRYVEWVAHRDRVLKEYGFTMDDYYRMCRLTESNTKVRCDESVRTFKEKQKIKLDKKLDECEIQGD